MLTLFTSSNTLLTSCNTLLTYHLLPGCDLNANVVTAFKEEKSFI